MPAVPDSVRSFTKRPVTITALQWDGKSRRADELYEWTGRPVTDGLMTGAVATQFLVLGEEDAYDVFRDYDEEYNIVGTTVKDLMKKGYTAVVWDFTHDAWLGIRTGDWVIKGLQGEFYPCHPDDFARIYADEVSTAPQGQ